MWALGAGDLAPISVLPLSSCVTWGKFPIIATTRCLLCAMVFIEMVSSQHDNHPYFMHEETLHTVQCSSPASGYQGRDSNTGHLEDSSPPCHHREAWERECTGSTWDIIVAQRTPLSSHRGAKTDIQGSQFYRRVFSFFPSLSFSHLIFTGIRAIEKYQPRVQELTLSPGSFMGRASGLFPSAGLGSAGMRGFAGRSIFADVRISSFLWSTYCGPSTVSSILVCFLISSSGQTREVDKVDIFISETRKLNLREGRSLS